MKKSAIDGLITQVDSNFQWANEPHSMRGAGKNISSSLRKDLLVGSRLANEHGRFSNSGMWGTTTKNTDRNHPKQIFTSSTYDNYDKKTSQASILSP
jgi:hypothetical protein